MNNLYISNRLQTIIQNWQEYHPNGKVLLIAKNKLDDVLVAVYSNNTISLLSELYTSAISAPKIMFSLYEDVLHIEDILMKTNDIGNGTIAMQALFVYAKEQNIKQITGTLSSVDDDHKDRRDHFYKKIGFIVTSNYISKELKE